MAYAPSAELVTPVADPVIPDLVNNILGGKQYISPSYWLGWAMKKVCGVNPWEWVAEQVAGDWHAAAEAGVALAHLAEFNKAYANAILSETKALFEQDWIGNAASGANTYFATLVTAINEQVRALEGISSQFRTMSAGMQEMAQALQSLMQDLLDLLILIGIEAAAAAASSWTVIGPILSGAAAVATIYEAIRVWYLALDAHDAAWAAVQAFTGLCAGYLGGLRGMEQHALPGSAYDHPGV